jgi:hypothetical protein
MKYAVQLAAAAMLVLGVAAPGAAAPGTPTAGTAEVAASAPVGVAPAFTAGQPPSRDFMVGTWGEGEACNEPLNFQADGTIKDGPVKAWTLEAGQLVIDGTFRVKLTVIDEKTMKSLADGTTETKTLKRCGS